MSGLPWPESRRFARPFTVHRQRDDAADSAAAPAVQSATGNAGPALPDGVMKQLRQQRDRHAPPPHSTTQAAATAVSTQSSCSTLPIFLTTAPSSARPPFIARRFIHLQRSSCGGFGVTRRSRFRTSPNCSSLSRSLIKGPRSRRLGTGTNTPWNQCAKAGPKVTPRKARCHSTVTAWSQPGGASSA
jgi:hypothetical protein